MAEWPGLPAGYDLPLVNSSTKRLPDPTMDAIEEALIPTIATSVDTAVDPVKYVNAAAAANARLIMGKMRRGVADAGALWISDSLNNETSEPAYRWAQHMASLFPAYTVEVRFWDEAGGTSYLSATTVQTGTGSRKLTVWICARAGEIPGYVLGSRYSAAVAATSPDIVFINHGHNTADPGTWSPVESPQRGIFMSLTEAIARTHPHAGIILIAENPSAVTGRETWQGIKADVLEFIAGLRGYGFIDVHKAFLDYGAWYPALMEDATHPNTPGKNLYASVINSAFTEATTAVPTRIEPSPLLLASRNLLLNPEFSDWSGTDPASWTPNASAATSKDTTNYESGAQACKVTANATSGTAQIEQMLGAAAIRPFRGEWLTLAVRVRQPASNGAVVRAALLDSTGGANSRNADVPTSTRDGFMWIFSSKRIDAAASAVYVRLIPRTSGTSLVEATFDRAYLVPGIMPNVGL